MDTDKVIQDLNRRFAAPLPEFYKRRIIFWYDEDKEFEERIDEVVLENAKVIALTGNNAFSVKKLLSVDDLTTNYLVYSPLGIWRGNPRPFNDRDESAACFHCTINLLKA